MQRFRVIVVTSDTALGRYLIDHLPRRRFEVVDIRPGPGFVEAAYHAPPHVAVLDGTDKRTGMAQLEIALLKKRQPRVRIILASGRSSAKEASLVEQGIFFYFAGRPRHELVRVVHAATSELDCHMDGMPPGAGK